MCFFTQIDSFSQQTHCSLQLDIDLTQIQSTQQSHAQDPLLHSSYFCVMPYIKQDHRWFFRAEQSLTTFSDRLYFFLKDIFF